MAITRTSQSTIKQRLEKNTSFFAGIPPILGRFESIATVTVGSGGASSIDFTSIPGTYQHLQVRGIMGNGGDAVLRTLVVRLGNGSLDTGSNYRSHFLYGDGASAYASTASTTTFELENSVAGTTANTFGAFVIDILDYANTSKYTTIRALHGVDINGSGKAIVASGLWLSTSAVDTLALGARSGFAGTLKQYSTAALYGIKAP